MHPDRRGLEGIVVRKHKGTPVLAIMVRSVWRSGKDIVPSARRELRAKRNEGGVVKRTQGYLTRRGGRRCMEEDFQIWFCIRGSTAKIISKRSWAVWLYGWCLLFTYPLVGSSTGHLGRCR